MVMSSVGDDLYTPSWLSTCFWEVLKNTWLPFFSLIRQVNFGVVRNPFSSTFKIWPEISCGVCAEKRPELFSRLSSKHNTLNSIQVRCGLTLFITVLHLSPLVTQQEVPTRDYGLGSWLLSDHRCWLICVYKLQCLIAFCCIRELKVFLMSELVNLSW